MTSCCWWNEEFGDPICKTVGRVCPWPGGGDEPAHPGLNARENCLARLHGTTVQDTGDTNGCSNLGDCCSSASCNTEVMEPGCCCFPWNWTLPDEPTISWLENSSDWQIPKRGQCIQQSYGNFYAYQMNKYRCNFYDGCWISNGVCDGGEFGGECPKDPCDPTVCASPNGCS